VRASLAAFGVPALLCALWVVWAGKDLNWDLLHYHYYVAHSLVEGRFLQDYFPARADSYANPLGYLPFYLMVSAGWHSVVVSVLLAAVHGANIGLLYLLSRRLFARRPPRERAVLSALGAALGAASAVFWATVGTSFLDPLLAAPMLAAVLFLADAGPGAPRRAAMAGALFGVAAALKYSNAFFALAGLALVATMPERRRALAGYAAAGAVASLLLAGPWMARLGGAFGNPFFPMLNGWFRSPEAPAFMLNTERFLPQSLSEALSLPLRMASPQSFTYAEISAPDFRFLALALAALALGLVGLRGASRAPAGGAEVGSADLRLFGFFLLCLAAWIATSANARYGLFVLLLVGPCLARAVEALLPLRYTLLVLPLLLVAQIATCASISPPRWFIAEQWSREWFAFAAPERWRNAPALYLTTEPQAMSVVTPFLHRDSAFMNLQGRPGDARTRERIDALLERSGGRPRVLGRGLRLQADGRPHPEVVGQYDATLIRFGWRLDAADCFAIPWRPDGSDTLSRLANAVSTQPPTRERAMSLTSCALLRADRDPREAEEELRVSALLDDIESHCPLLFRGQTAVTERFGAEWSRSYPGLEARLETHGGRVVLVSWFKPRYIDLGPLDDGGRDRIPPVCRG